MKKGGIWNPQLAELVARMGHRDMILIGDRGMPFPKDKGVTCVDLSIRPGVPGSAEILEMVLEELEVESVIITDATKELNPKLYSEFKDILSRHKNQGNEIEERNIPYPDFKNYLLTGQPLSQESFNTEGIDLKGIVRTGECTVHGYILLLSGVIYG